jgi:hypothetical protein
MKLSYTTEEIERWRNKVHRRLPRLLVRTKEQALDFLNDIGYCFEFKSNTSELPSLWYAAHGIQGSSKDGRRFLDSPKSFIRETERALLTEKKIYFGRVLRRRPTLISLGYLPYFFALHGREGKKDDYLTEFMQGRLSADGKTIMGLLVHSSPRVTKDLKKALGNHHEADGRRFERAILELQSRLFVTRAGESQQRLVSSWATVYDSFPASVKKAQGISSDGARKKILGKFFENQLVSSVEDIWRVFGWNKQSIYQALGWLVQSGTITGNVEVDGKDSKYYCLVH